MSKRWQDWEIELISDPSIPLKRVAALTGRTMPSVKKKARKLGIDRRDGLGTVMIDVEKGEAAIRFNYTEERERKLKKYRPFRTGKYLVIKKQEEVFRYCNDIGWPERMKKVKRILATKFNRTGVKVRAEALD